MQGSNNARELLRSLSTYRKLGGKANRKQIKILDLTAMTVSNRGSRHEMEKKKGCVRIGLCGTFFYFIFLSTTYDCLLATSGKRQLK